MDDDNRAALHASAESIRANRGLVLVGPVGTGKTTLLAMLARALWRKDVIEGAWSPSRSDRVYQTWMSNPAFFSVASEFCEDVKAGWGRKFDGPPSLEPFYSPMGVASRCRRLFLDDLGAEPATAACVQMVVDVLAARHALRAPTWIATNLTPDEFRERYGTRVWDRLRADATWVELLGESRRVTA